MKIVYAGWKQMSKFNFTCKELKYKPLAPKTPIEVDDTLGRQMVKKYADIHELSDYEKNFGPLKQEKPVEAKKEKKTQKDKMMAVEVQEDKSAKSESK